MVNVLVYSPVRLFGEGLAACLTACNGAVDARVVGTVSSPEDLEPVIEANRPLLLLFDVTRGEALVDAHRIIGQWPDVPVVAIALPEEPGEVVHCAEAGFAGYVPTHGSMTDLAAVIRASIAGELICSPLIAAELVRELRRRPRPSNGAAEPLTTRERQILALVARGQCNKEIARELDLSVATVKNHVHNIFAKLCVGSRREAIVRLRADPAILNLA
ncbi:conserved hypothetical protein [uncultured Defluviicoccus sp.]|uniref:Response regulator transcription factor n=1 Tax=metagenome TaxID=256318 RepID=A0A380TI19_9ZZZZ|nr:conserved hypothetical protein [uncultured Defluviicoccus sp.]